MGGVLYPDAPGAIWVFLSMTVVLGGLAAWATGRALAKTWRPYVQVLIYMIPLAAAMLFLHYALFGEKLLSIHYYIVNYLIAAIAASVGFRRMRVQQMLTQYSFAFAPAGPFGWQPKGR
jgi:hypothetical protein